MTGTTHTVTVEEGRIFIDGVPRDYIACSPCPEGLSLGPVVDEVQTFYGPLGAARAAGILVRGGTDEEFDEPGVHHPDDWIVQCQAPPAPQTEDVPWWEALRDRRTVVPEEGEPFVPTAAIRDGDVLRLIGTDVYQLVRPDGTVTVERES